MTIRRPGLVYLALFLVFVVLIALRVARDETAQGDRAALFLERCRLEAPEATCEAALSQRGTTCQTTWYGEKAPDDDRWSGYYTCVRGSEGRVSPVGSGLQGRPSR